ncbi:hypothetical protein Patl1_04033 [Pistacia atlantica]|uniref:Uncharacterized protein n=1 Tax=Pistacia atlantica TaxID=434234 RepID=A0ACC1BQB2_9ROSI|nr:hypothetical protein Patl1_04033 [Pistacia atlantica]
MLKTSRLIVETDSPGWHKSIIKLLSIVEGASYRIDAQQGYAYISGKVDRGDFLKMVAKLKEHIQLYHMEYDYGYQGHAQNQHSAASSDAKSPDRQKPAI